MKTVTFIILYLSISSRLLAQRPPQDYKVSFYSSQGSEIESSNREAKLNEFSLDAPIAFLGFNEKRNWLAALEFNYTNSTLDIEQNDTLNLHHISFPLLFIHQPLGNSQWSPTAFIVPIFSGDRIDFDLDQFFISGLVGAQKRYSNGLKLTLGALYLETQGEPLLTPALALEYAFANFWNVEWRGPKIKLTRAQDNLTLGLTLENNGRIWHLSDTSRDLSFNQLQIGGLAHLKLNNQSALSFQAGINILGSLDTLENSDSILEEDLSSGFYFSTQYTLTF